MQKGVLLPLAALTAQCRSLVEAWEYKSQDHLLHVLPLHHIHGVINALMAPVFAGASVEFMFPFNARSIWERFAAPFLRNNEHDDHPQRIITIFTAVPTMYTRLISTFPDLPLPLQEAAREAVSPKIFDSISLDQHRFPLPRRRHGRSLVTVTSCSSVMA